MVIQMCLRESFETVSPEKVVRFQAGVIQVYKDIHQDIAKRHCRINNRYFKKYLKNNNKFYVKGKSCPDK